MAIGSSGGAGSGSPYNDVHTPQPELDILYKKIQSTNNLKLCQWKYQMLRNRYQLQVKLASLVLDFQIVFVVIAIIT